MKLERLIPWKKEVPAPEMAAVPTPTYEELIADLETQGFKIIPSTFEKRSGEIDFTGFETEDEQGRKILHSRLSDLVDNIQGYLSGPLFMDNFGSDHDARKLWETQMFPKYGKPLEELTHTNRIAGGNMSVIVFMRLERVVRLLDELNINSPQAATLKELCDSFPDTQKSVYNPLSLEEKLAVVSKVENICMKILDMLIPERGLQH